MREFDFSPLFRSAIGFNRLPTLVNTARRSNDAVDAYPPYNIEKLDDDAYRVSVAVAGFSDADLAIEVREAMLVVTGDRTDTSQDKPFLHRGIAGRSFTRRFQLAEHVEVRHAALANGLLTIDLVREVPEALKPRKIDIIANSSATIEGPAAA